MNVSLTAPRIKVSVSLFIGDDISILYCVAPSEGSQESLIVEFP